MADFNSHLLCALISGGQSDILDGIDAADFIVAADRGWDYAQKYGINPDLIIGDFDSCAAGKQSALKNLATAKNSQNPLQPEMIRMPREKDDSDTLLALKYCLKRGYRKFRIYCALGGRLDHLLANLQAFAFGAESGAEIEVISAQDRIVYLHNNKQNFPYLAGFSLSVFSLSDTSSGVTIKNALYELQDACLHRSFPIGLSNGWKNQESVEISVAKGTLAVISSRL